MKKILRAFHACCPCATAFVLVFGLPKATSAQPCSPTVTEGSIYISFLKFNYSSAMPDGKEYITGSNGYSETVAVSSGTIERYRGTSIWYGLQNPLGSPQSFRIGFFADWNNDGDFDDLLETYTPAGATIGAGSYYGTGFTLTPPLFCASSVRVRVVLSLGTTDPSPCGSVTGEVEDYLLEPATNHAPVLYPAATPFLNDLLPGQTNSEGCSIDQLISSASPAILATDGNDNGNALVPRGLAITGQSASNGTWQFRIGSGAWQPFGAVAESNALLLLGNGNTYYQDNVRIRFVPTGTGPASLTYRLWDGTEGTTGAYVSITTTGGSSAFSTESKTTSLQVISSPGIMAPLFLSTTGNRIYQSHLFAAAGKSVAPGLFLDVHNEQTSNDITLGAYGSKVYWISGKDADGIAMADADGSHKISSLVTEVEYGIGLAAGPDKLFYTDWTPGIFSTDLQGGSKTALSGGPGQLDPNDIGDIGDIEYADGRIYFVYYSYQTLQYRIMSADTEGNSLTEMYSSDNFIKGLFVSGTHLYWTEIYATPDPDINWVMKKPLAGGTALPLASQSGRNFNDLAADEANGFVYVVTAGYNTPELSELRRLPIDGGPLTTILSMNGIVTALAFQPTGITLPVSLLRFEAKLLPTKAAQLSWTSSREENSRHYLLEKSSDGRTFQPLATVTATGSQNRGVTYKWIDANLSAGTHFYRLSESGHNGQVKVLGTRQLTVKATGTLQAYPNPVTGGSLTVNTGSAPQVPIRYTLHDAAGRTVVSGSLTQQQQQLSLGKLAPGYYVLRLADGRQLPLTVK